MEKKDFLGSSKLAQVIADIAPFRCLDIGVRGGFLKDLNPMAWAVDISGFDADKSECDRLNTQYLKPGSHPFRNVTFYPVALGQRAQKRTFWITNWGGTSSFLQPIAEIGDKFSRIEFVTVKETREIDTVPLDDFINTNGLHDIVFTKLDVEGLELEILQSAKNLLQSSLLAIRSEVVFLGSHSGHPLYGEMEAFLRDYGFMPMEFLDLNHWRRLTRIKYPDRSNGLIPFSKGQLAHGDVLFFKDPDILKDDTVQQIELLLKAAVLAITYGYIDHAYYILKRPSVKQYLELKYSLSLEREIRKISLNLASQYRRKRIGRLLSPIRTRIGSFLSKHPILQRVKKRMEVILLGLYRWDRGQP